MFISGWLLVGVAVVAWCVYMNHKKKVEQKAKLDAIHKKLAQAKAFYEEFPECQNGRYLSIGGWAGHVFRLLDENRKTAFFFNLRLLHPGQYRDGTCKHTSLLLLNLENGLELEYYCYQRIKHGDKYTLFFSETGLQDDNGLKLEYVHDAESDHPVEVMVTYKKGKYVNLHSSIDNAAAYLNYLHSIDPDVFEAVDANDAKERLIEFFGFQHTARKEYAWLEKNW